PSQLGHFEGEARQQLRTGRRLPPSGQEGLGHRCSDLLWWSEQSGQMGWVTRHLCWTWPKSQQFRHWVTGEEEYAFSTLREPPKRYREGSRVCASVGSILTTTEKALFSARELRSGLRKRVAEMETPLELRIDSWSLL